MRLRLAVQPIYAAPGTLEPTINVAEQNTAGLRCYGSKIASRPDPACSIWRHTREPAVGRRSGWIVAMNHPEWVANATEQSPTPTLIRPRPIGSGLCQHLN